MTIKEEQVRSWRAVEFEVKSEHEDLASWLMMNNGSKGCQLSPSKEAQVLLHATFDVDAFPDTKPAELKCLLENYDLAYCLNSFQVKTIAEEDWLAEWKKGYVPFAIGDKFLVCPPWLRASLTEQQTRGRHVLYVEPGLAFGTGLHATTQYCIKALELQDSGGDIVDVGCGSGILAMAAAMLKPEAKVSAVDNDPLAVKVARDNFQLNQVSDRIVLKEGSTELFDNQAFDCILSNLTCEDNIALLLEYLRMLRPDGIVICAGILKEKLPRLEKAIESYPLSVVHQELSDMWAGVTLQRIGVTIGRR